MKYKHTNVGVGTVGINDSTGKYYVLGRGGSVILNEKLNLAYISVEPVDSPKRIKNIKTVKEDD